MGVTFLSLTVPGTRGKALDPLTIFTFIKRGRDFLPLTWVCGDQQVIHVEYLAQDLTPREAKSRSLLPQRAAVLCPKHACGDLLQVARFRAFGVYYLTGTRAGSVPSNHDSQKRVKGSAELQLEAGSAE